MAATGFDGDYMTRVADFLVGLDKLTGATGIVLRPTTADVTGTNDGRGVWQTIHVKPVVQDGGSHVYHVEMGGQP